MGLGLALLVSAAPLACGGEPEDDGPNSPLAPVGTVVVTWDFARQDGNETTCTEVGAAEVYTYVGGRRSDAARAAAGDGGTAPPVFCGDEQREVWTQLIEATLPVYIEVRTLGGEILTDFTGTVRVVPQMQTVVDHTFAISGTGPSQGDLVLDWTVDGLDPAAACAEVGAETVTFATRAGSIEDFDATVPCSDGSLRLEDLRAGGYIVRAQLLDPLGEVLSVDELEPNVPADGEERSTFRFNIASLERSRVRAEWTINGQPAATECVVEDLFEVEVRFQRLDFVDLEWVTAETATAACEAGSVLIDELVVSGQPRLELLLFDDFSGERIIVTSTTTDPFPLEPGQTATVTADFDLTGG